MFLSCPAARSSHCVADIDSLQYGLCANLDNADDNALAYVAHILPYAASCNLTAVQIQVKRNWLANTNTWHTVDDALLSLAQSALFRVVVAVDPSAEVPSLEDLPYECTDDLCKEVLPRCVARGHIRMYCEKSVDLNCRLHDSRR